VGGDRSPNTTVPCLSINFHSPPLWKCDTAKLRNQLRALQCTCPRFGKHDVRGYGTRNADVGSRSKTDIVTPCSWSTRARTKPPTWAGSNNSNGERRLGHKSHITDRLKEQAIFSTQRRIFEGLINDDKFSYYRNCQNSLPEVDWTSSSSRSSPKEAKPERHECYLRY
jgi:hypothetical protein